MRQPDVKTWNVTVTDDAHPNFPYEYYKTFAAQVIMIVSVILPNIVAKPLINTLLNVLMSDPSMAVAQDWAKNQFTPAMLRVSTDFKLPLIKSMKLLKRFVGVLIKLAWAFLW